jgi:hypothetical protein
MKRLMSLTAITLVDGAVAHSAVKQGMDPSLAGPFQD